ncbi:MAG: 16S rRNA (adenine(1518)-N(6)/adenine(1519)-N(6))-dimethyltransferase RsmA [Parachlamydiaceae bacterium]
MPIYKPTELRLFLNELGIFPKKGLSQNFLIDGNIIRKIVTASEVQRDDLILEIGPGPGSLTQALLETGAQVIAVEKDEVLAKELERLQTATGQLSVFCHDIMTFPLEKEIAKRLKPGQKAKVIANLPYHLTTPIIAQFAQLHPFFSSLTVMVQEEVGRRMTAHPGTSEYSSFTVFLGFYTHAHYAFTVSRNCFYPVPKVDSSVIVLHLHEPLLPKEAASSFFRLTRTAFEHRRKMLRASLKELFPPDKVEEALETIGQNRLARPEVLSLNDFLRLHALLNQLRVSD